MTDNLKSAMFVSASGMRAQGFRLKIVAQNIANVSSTADKPGADPYRRKVTRFENVLDRELNAKLVKAQKVFEDPSAFGIMHDPKHPAADEKGIVKTPNVNTVVEMMDMREAQRSYEANLSMIETSKSMMSRTIGLLR